MLELADAGDLSRMIKVGYFFNLIKFVSSLSIICKKFLIFNWLAFYCLRFYLHLDHCIERIRKKDIYSYEQVCKFCPASRGLYIWNWLPKFARYLHMKYVSAKKKTGEMKSTTALSLALCHHSIFCQCFHYKFSFLRNLLF